MPLWLESKLLHHPHQGPLLTQPFHLKNVSTSLQKNAYGDYDRKASRLDFLESQTRIDVCVCVLWSCWRSGDHLVDREGMTSRRLWRKWKVDLIRRMSNEKRGSFTGLPKKGAERKGRQQAVKGIAKKSMGKKAEKTRRRRAWIWVF